MEKLIPIINKLQDVLSTVKSQPLDLPQIAVVGSQSTGKSSVLENLVGSDFLPRGNGIVTRRPLILQLFNTGEGGEEWGEFLHLPGQKFYDFYEIREEIANETERIAPGKGISREPINLKVYSPKVLNLTMVDLPGLTKVPVGNQPSDIDQQIRELVLEYISRPNCVILAVSAANVDIATSDALQIAREVDPEGNRTLGVLTKVDLMDRGTDCLGVLNGEVIPLKLGYIAVVNRSQQDIIENKKIEASQKSEREFFIKHPSYRHISDRLGFIHLSRTMNRLLINHIKKVLPALKQDIHANIALLNEELAGYGDTIIDGTENQGALLLHLLSKFASGFCDAIDGTASGNNHGGYELYGGARIINIFHSVFAGELEMIGPFSGLSDESIRIAIRNSTGARLALFVPDRAFEILVRQQIQKLRVPCLSCVERVFEELQRVASNCENNEIKRFRSLNEKLTEVVDDMMRKFLEPTLEYVNQIIDVELAYINTKHPDFISIGQAAANVYSTIDNRKKTTTEPKPAAVKKERPKPEKEEKGFFGIFGGNERKAKKPVAREQQRYQPPENQPLPMNAREQGELNLIKSLLQSYYSIVKKQVSDQVPKSIMYFLVNQSKNAIQSELVSSLYKEGQFEELLAESPEIAHKRRQCRELISIMKKALQIVTEVRDFKVN